MGRLSTVFWLVSLLGKDVAVCIEMLLTFFGTVRIRKLQTEQFIPLEMRITNEEIKRRVGMETIIKQVAERRWAWLGPALRMDHLSHPRISLTWIPEGKRKEHRRQGGEQWKGSSRRKD